MKKLLNNDLERVDGVAKVTGAAQYAAEYNLPGIVYGVLVGSKITKGKILAIDTSAAQKSAGVLEVITHKNSIKVPGYDAGGNPVKGPTGGKGLQVFVDDTIFFNGQPVALVVADSFERAVHAASLVKCQYGKEEFNTDLDNLATASSAIEGNRYADNVRGEKDGWKKAPVQVQAEYVVPLEVHNPMELHSITVHWEADDKVKVYDKTQGVKSTQRSIMQAFKLDEKNVQVIAEYVGGGFGSALRTWPHEIAALIGAKKVNRPLKLMLTRDQMFTLVGFRPYTYQKINLGATNDGKLVGLTHEAYSHTSPYEEFTEGTVNISRLLYACPNVTTRYKVFPRNLSTPTWMRGPGEATGAHALESALDELSYKLGIDPVELRVRNHADTDPQSGKPFSSKFLKEAYALGAEKIEWKKRSATPNATMENGWKSGYGMAGGVFNAGRGSARASARFTPDGRLLIQSAVADSGPGTATSMVLIAAGVTGIKVSNITFDLGDSSLPPGPTQGGSTTTSTLGSAVHDTCLSLLKKFSEYSAKATILKDLPFDQLNFEDGYVSSKSDSSRKMLMTDVLNGSGLNQLEVVEESKGGEQQRNYASYSYSVHFVKVLVHPLTGRIKVSRVVTVADSGRIISEKTAASQMIGGVTGGIGMALMEEGIIDDRYGRWVNNNFADYHVPVHADVPHIETIFVNKPDPVINPIGAKGMGEIALIGFSAAVGNAVFNATGIRVRDLPITLDKVLTATAAKA